MIKRLSIVICLLAFMAAAVCAQTPRNTATPDTMSTVQDKKTLYARLGGYDAIALVVDDFIHRLATDKRFEKFFTGFSEDSQKRLRQHILDQFCMAAGGPCVYTGREMRTVHKGLGITEADWRAMGLIGYDIAPIPEPTSLSLLLLGGVAAAVVRRRQV